ncbi:MAG: hypothetical protein E7230_03310 [Clostridiales bacterium]|nr:hypothetical protein [Clostridiales bacterium]MBR0469519.1 hypothetical protein [Mogibacterium sp.]
MDFSVRTTTLKQSPDNIDELVKALRSYSDVVSAVAADPHIDSDAKAQIAASLKKTSAAILTTAAAADSFSKALRLIAKNYEETEKTLLTLASEKRQDVARAYEAAVSAVSASDSIRNTDLYRSIRMWLIEKGIIKAKKQTRTEGQPVTEYQEKEMDLYMQQEIRKLSKDDERFTENYWKNASVEDRKEILEDYIKKVCRIMGLPEVDIDWEYSPAEAGEDGRSYVTRGFFDRDDNSVHINEWVLENGDENGFPSYRQVSTITHELRHYYQHEAVSNPDKYVVTADTINSWEDSFNNYHNTEGFMRQGMTQQEAYEAYRNQAVEVDARRFAGQE